MDTTSIIDKLNLVHVDVQSVSGTVSKSEDSRDEAFTNGSVRYLDRKHLRAFSRIRQKANRICRQHGSRFLNAWATPDDAMQEIRSELADLELEASAARNELVANLQVWRQEWILQHPEIMPYSSRFPSDQAIIDQVSMAVSVYKIVPQLLEGVDDGIASEIGGLAGQVLTEIAGEIRDSFSANAQMAKSGSRDILNRIRVKLERFAFVDVRLKGVADMIEKTLALLPQEGPIRGQAFVTFSGLTSVLSDPDSVLIASEHVSADGDRADGFVSFINAASPVSNEADLPETTHTPSEHGKQTHEGFGLPSASDFLNDHLSFVPVSDEKTAPTESSFPAPPPPQPAPAPPVEDDSAWSW